ncbi:MAG: transcriptional regulator [Pseudomonadota bacterium]
MARKAFEMMMEGLDDAIAFAEGDAARARVATVDVRQVRAGTKLSQAKFAQTYHFRIGTLQDWEQGRRQPDTGSLTLLRMIQADPRAVQDILSKVTA